MNIATRSKRPPRNIERRRHGQARRGIVRPVEPSAQPPDVSPMRQGGPTQDRALYTCQCGYVFEATVSTSVGCPYCGGTQAW